MRESSHPLAGLRQRIARIAASDGVESRRAEGWLASGHAPFDAALGGGLAAGRTHEFFAAEFGDAGGIDMPAALAGVARTQPDQRRLARGA